MRPSNSTKNERKRPHTFFWERKRKKISLVVSFSASVDIFIKHSQKDCHHIAISLSSVSDPSFAENSKMLFRVNNTEEKSMAGQRRWCQIEENQDWKAWRKENYTLARIVRIHKKIASQSKKNQIRNNVIT